MDRKDEGGVREMRKIPFLSSADIQQLQHDEVASNKEQKRTAEQIEAIYSSGQNILVSASAGSGKTFVMVQRIIDQLLRGVSIQELFISTFTVKAAGELKERLEKELSKQLKESSDEELKQHLAQQLAAIATADIGTMDSFTQKVLNKYGYLLGLAPNFRILQSASEQTMLQNEVFQQLFEQYYVGDKKEIFEKLVKNFTGTKKNISGFRKQVYATYRFLQSTSNPEYWLNEVFLTGYENTDFEMERDKLSQQVKVALFDLEDYFRFHLDHEGQEFSGAKYQENVLIALDLLSSLHEVSSSQDYFRVLRELVRLSRASGGKAFAISTRKEELKELASAFNLEKKSKIEHLRTLEASIYQFEFLEKYQDDSLPLLYLLRDFMRDFTQAYLDRKKLENAFEFGDISHFAIQILEEFPEVRSFYQERYHEVMVDEYQDTNHTQERMLELLSNGHNRFMVGDIKQSIYRFRQADPQIFSEKFKRYQEDSSQGKLIVLKENFRSHIEVLEATNDVFKRLMDEQVGEINYDETHYLVAGNPDKALPNPQNRAEVLLYDDSVADEEVDESISVGEVTLVIKEIIRLHQEKGVAFKDITLLTASRTRNDMILAEFAKHHIPLVPDGGEDNYLQSVEVMVMLDTLRTINNPLNDYALTALLKSPMFDFGEDELARIALQKRHEKLQENLYEKLENALASQGVHQDLILPDLKRKLQLFQKTLLEWRTFAKTHSLYELIWKIYQDRLYYDYVGALPNGAQRQVNLYALSLRANDYEKSSFKGLSRFIGMIDKILENQHDLASVPFAAPQDAVRLMTVHKSKGLEFKYVFLLNIDKAFNRQDTSSNIILSRKNGIGIKYIADVELEKSEGMLTHVRLSMDTLPYQKNLEEIRLASLSEQMRLLYVAMTRAETKLYLIGKGSQEKLEKRNWGQAEHGRLPLALRNLLSSFQDWMYAIWTVFSDDHLAFDVRFVRDEELTSDKVGQIIQESPFDVDNLADNRQSDDIVRALEVLENVDRLNRQYAAAIELPSVRTPSQVKKLYEPVMESDGVEIMDKKTEILQPQTFVLPDFIKKSSVTGAQVGSAVHELMQKIPLDTKPDRNIIKTTLQQVQAEAAVKEKIDLDKIVAFFESSLGKIMQEYKNNLHREAPFAMLKKDKVSGQDFVVRGILDGYLLLEDKIVLFDYKTDKFRHAQDLVERYRSQLSLYAEALSRSYGISQVEKYLILLGGSDLQVVKVEE